MALDSHFTTRSPLEGAHFQVLVIGGGINGAAIARECALKGFRTLLVEQRDFASGTTGRSTRMVAGGLPGQEPRTLGSLFKTVRERDRLLAETPHLVQSLRCLLAQPSGNPGNGVRLRATRWLTRRLSSLHKGLEPSLTSIYRLNRILGQNWSIFDFEDAQCTFPERLTADWIADAAQAGATVRNYTQVLAVDIRHGRVQGALIRDLLTRREERVQATWTVNATGPWVDRLCQRSRFPLGRPMVQPARTLHLVLSNFAGAPDFALHKQDRDGRTLSVIPWNDQLLVGSTEIPDTTDPDKVRPNPAEIDDLLQQLLQTFAGAKISHETVRYAVAGILPRPSFSGRGTGPGDSLIDHKSDGAAQMLSVAGGELKYAAATARMVAEKVSKLSKPAQACVQRSQQSALQFMDAFRDEYAKQAGISEAAAEAIVEFHGPRSAEIAKLALMSPELRAPLCPHSQHLVAEAVHAFRDEFATNLADVLLRRVPVALGSCWSPSCSRVAAVRIAAAMGWNEFQSATELETFETERETFLLKPSKAGLALPAAAD
jgi:glycerol-3-phosphate dehydrogenase